MEKSKGGCTNCLPEIEGAYVYPVLSQESMTRDEVIQAYQLPEDILKKSSSVSLIRSLLDMPMLSGTFYTSSDASPTGRSYLFYALHNSVQELDRREDNAYALIEYYHAVCFDCFKAFDPSSVEDAGKEMRLQTQLIALQTLFTREKILDKLDTKDRQDLVALLLTHLEQLDNLNIRLATLEVIAWIMYDDQYAPIVTFYDSNLNIEWLVDIPRDEVIIISFAKDYIQ
jgi:hypothetical protein